MQREEQVGLTDNKFLECFSFLIRIFDALPASLRVKEIFKQSRVCHIKLKTFSFNVFRKTKTERCVINEY